MIERFVCYDLGRMRFGPCLELMETLHAEVAQGLRRPLWLAVEHEPVITMGQRKLLSDLRFDPQNEQSRDLKCDYFEIDRGGSATAHEPGQLVVYPIVPLSYFSRSVRLYVDFLEEGVIRTCKDFAVDANRDSINPGVWCGLSKIAAVGVRVRDHVTKHGLAFNICNDLRSFDSIIPCGLHGRGVTTLELEMSKRRHSPFVSSVPVVRVSEVLDKLLHHYSRMSRTELGQSWDLQKISALPDSKS